MTGTGAKPCSHSKQVRFKHRHWGAGTSICVASAIAITHPKRHNSFLEIKRAPARARRTKSDVTLTQSSVSKKFNAHSFVQHKLHIKKDTKMAHFAVSNIKTTHQNAIARLGWHPAYAWRLWPTFSQIRLILPLKYFILFCRSFFQLMALLQL